MQDETKTFDQKKFNEAGFSLIELFIALIVFSIFISSIYGLLRIGSLQKSTINSQIEVMTNLRLSLNSMGQDIVNAGFGYSRSGGFVPDNLTNALMSIPADTNAQHDLLTAVVAGNNINSNNFLPNNQRTDVVAFASRDFPKFIDPADTRVPPVPKDCPPISITTAAANGANGVTATTVPGPNPACDARPYDLYLISNGTRTTLAMATSVPNNTTLRFEIGDPLGINLRYVGSDDTRSKLVNCADNPVSPPIGCMDYTVGVTAKKIFWVCYRVTADGTLTRTSFGNNTGRPASEQIQTQPIAFNIQNFQVRYLMRPANGTVIGTVTDDPSNNGANPNDLNNVVQIDATISARVSVQENGTTIEKVVDLNSTFSTKNLTYRIAIQ